MTQDVVDRLLLATAAMLGLVTLVLALPTLSWPMVFDGSLMAYVSSRIWDGAVPYRDVYDMNLPGTYVLHVPLYGLTGTNPLAWRLVDVVATALGALGVAALARPFGRATGWLAAFGFVAYHHVHGDYGLGERDFLVAVMQVWATVWVLGDDESIGPSRGRLFAAGALLGWGTAIKPILAVYALGLGGVHAVAARRRDVAWPTLFQEVGIVVTGGVVVVGALVAWMASLGALGPMLAMFREMMPVHNGLVLPWSRQVLLLLFEPPVWLLPLAVLLPVWGTQAMPAHRHALLLGVVYGLFHWFFQGKAWDYHLHPFAAFAWPAALVGVQQAWDRRPWAALGPAVLTIASLVMLMQWAWTWVYLTNNHLEILTRNRAAVTEALGPDDTVQIIGDVASGIHALATLGRPMATPFLYDFHFYTRTDAPEVVAWQQRFLTALDEAEPDVVVVSVHSWPTNGFERLDAFPALVDWIEAHYTLERDNKAYRIYRRRTSTHATPADAG